MTTLKHQISEYGIVCCGLNYYDKHKWVNHKKSVKHHRMSQDDDDTDPSKLLNLPTEPKKKMDLTISMKDHTESATTEAAITNEATTEAATAEAVTTKAM